MIRAATAQDAPAIERFLARHAETSMFLRSNLASHGIGSDHPHGTDFFLWHKGAALGAVFGATRGGFLLCQMPQADAEAAHSFLHTVQNRAVQGLTGEAAQVRVLQDALSFPQAAWRRQEDEPLFSLELKDLPASADVNKLRLAGLEDRIMLADWFRDYQLDTGLSTAGPDLDAQSQARAEATIHRSDLRLLIEDGVPAAMVDFNAVMPGLVQVGGVFVPRAQRNRGLGRRVVAARLTQAYRDGQARRAILFAASPAAARAYAGLGFRQIGHYRTALLKAPRRVQ
ncbi:GNAT family N-acetyltransferase [Aliishimia ponticola]|uniref:GNAT family N-acetyltransferase n=1 Tax=Aliishimia ponticola TaxID=2499833 RepID=A0A4S4N7B7_9RHOB|nr:GNAT family N-acetyltransferase [Aliishimia ponticola]THH34415.1 GNAT family N-acetyltransferase [Aliishimia ponticola]